MSKLISASHSKYQIVYHIQWCTKYRYEALKQDKYKKQMEEIITEVAQRHSITILELAVCSEHVHAVVQTTASTAPARVSQILKGASSFYFFQKNPRFRKRYPRGHFWSRGKYYGTVGNADLETVKNYVRKQSTLAQFT